MQRFSARRTVKSFGQGINFCGEVRLLLVRHLFVSTHKAVREMANSVHDSAVTFFVAKFANPLETNEIVRVIDVFARMSSGRWRVVLVAEADD